MDDLKCSLLSDVVSNNSSHVLHIIDMYGLTQLITVYNRTNSSHAIFKYPHRFIPYKFPRLDIKVKCYLYWYK